MFLYLFGNIYCQHNLLLMLCEHIDKINGITLNFKKTKSFIFNQQIIQIDGSPSSICQKKSNLNHNPSLLAHLGRLFPLCHLKSYQFIFVCPSLYFSWLCVFVSFCPSSSLRLIVYHKPQHILASLPFCRFVPLSFCLFHLSSS